MKTSNLVRMEPSIRDTLLSYSKASVTLLVIAAFCLSLNCNLAQARIKIDPDDDPVGDDGGGGGGVPAPAPAPPPPRPAAPPPSYDAWTTAHGGSDNTGFARVVTAPAIAPSAIVDVGPLNPDANPVTGRDGTVYIGNLKGELIALHPDGSLYWKRQLVDSRGLSMGGIYASPVIGGDGSIYVVSGIGFNDHRTGNPPYGATSYLHKFSQGGGWVGWARFPLNGNGTGATVAPPNLWSYNGVEVILIPVQYKPYETTKLFAFSTSLSVLSERIIAESPITGGSGDGSFDAFMCYFNPVVAVWNVFTLWQADPCRSYLNFVSEPTELPNGYDSASLYNFLGGTSNVAIRQFYAGESPHIFVSAKANPGGVNTLEYLFDTDKNLLRNIATYYDDKKPFHSSLVALSTDEVVAGTNEGLRFVKQKRYLNLGGYIGSHPAVTPNGRIAAVSESGWLSTVLYGNLESQQGNNGPTMASPASSCTHLFVAVENELVTYDVGTFQAVFRFPWTEGGHHSTIIGPLGHVYATNEHGIYVFPPEPNRDPKDVTGTHCT